MAAIASAVDTGVGWGARLEVPAEATAGDVREVRSMCGARFDLLFWFMLRTEGPFIGSTLVTCL